MTTTRRYFNTTERLAEKAARQELAMTHEFSETERPNGPVPEPEPKPEPEPVPPDPTPQLVMSHQQMIEMISAAVGAAVSSAAKAQADPLADAMKRALKPENAFSPQFSVFNPAGERDHPRPQLRCPYTLFDGIPIDGTTETVEELTLMNGLEAGEYFVTKSDNTQIPFRVTEHRNDLGVLKRVDISFPYRDESDRQGLMPMAFWLKEVHAQMAARKQAQKEAAALVTA